MSAAETAPDLFELEGGGVHLTYSTTSITGEAELRYRDRHRGEISFTGDDIREQETEVGRLVTVTLQRSVDQGGVLFTLLLPPAFVRMDASGSSFETEGIVTTQHVAVDNPTVKGPSVTYEFLRLHGTARSVEF